jgi:hypothetical protein
MSGRAAAASVGRVQFAQCGGARGYQCRVPHLPRPFPGGAWARPALLYFRDYSCGQDAPMRAGADPGYRGMGADAVALCPDSVNRYDLIPGHKYGVSPASGVFGGGRGGPVFLRKKR